MSKERERPSNTSERLIARAQAGDTAAISTLFRRNALALRRWAHGRLPHWARRGRDTADLVQDALFQTFRNLDRFDNRGRGALQAYLRQAVTNRIRDELRRVESRATIDETPERLAALPAREPSPFDATLDVERQRKYKEALTTLTEDERMLVVARIEMAYTYEQLALMTNRATPDAARIAVRRAVLKVAERMSGV